MGPLKCVSYVLINKELNTKELLCQTLRKKRRSPASVAYTTVTCFCCKYHAHLLLLQVPQPPASAASTTLTCFCCIYHSHLLLLQIPQSPASAANTTLTCSCCKYHAHLLLLQKPRSPASVANITMAGALSFSVTVHTVVSALINLSEAQACEGELCMYACMCACAHVHTFVCVCVCACVCVCVRM